MKTLNWSKPADAPVVGETFTKAASQRYTQRGVKGEHVTVTRYLVTEVSDEGLTAEGIETVEETGRPTFAGENLGSGSTQMIWLGWNAAVTRGDITREA